MDKVCRASGCYFRHLVAIRDRPHTALTYHRTWETGPDGNEGRQSGPGFCGPRLTLVTMGVRLDSSTAFAPLLTASCPCILV